MSNFDRDHFDIRLWESFMDMNEEHRRIIGDLAEASAQGEKINLYDALGKKVDEAVIIAEAVTMPLGMVKIIQRESDGKLVILGTDENNHYGRYFDIRVHGGNSLVISLYTEKSGQ